MNTNEQRPERARRRNNRRRNSNKEINANVENGTVSAGESKSSSVKQSQPVVVSKASTEEVKSGRKHRKTTSSTKHRAGKSNDVKSHENRNSKTKELVRPRRQEITGVLRAHPRGFGFLEREGEPSIFIPPTKMRGLLDADVISAMVREGKDEADRTRLVLRTRNEAVGEVTKKGTFRIDAGIGHLEMEIEGTVPAEGTCVIVDIVGEKARVKEILGDPLSSQSLIRRMLTRHRLPHLHSSESIAEGDRISQREIEGGRRRDLTGQTIITIDADHSEDLDDALAAEPGPDGSIRIWVHIADVSAHVTPGSIIDRQAALTPTSIYLPNFTRHMLPPRLGASRLSLLPGVDRDALTVEMRIDAAGVVNSVDIYESRIRSNQRLSYVTVARLLDGEEPHQIAVDNSQAQLVRYLWAAAVRLGHQRDARGGVDAWRGDRDPQIPVGEDNAHLLVERLMVATNEAVANWLEQRGMPVLARTHSAPTDESVKEIEIAANSIGLWAALPRPVTPDSFAALAAQAAGNRHNRIFWESVMSAMERARYTTTPGGHFGLGSNRYLHFTSPLRRYADLLVHRVIKSYLDGERSTEAGPLEEAAAVINDVGRRADLAEKQTKRAESLKNIRPREIVRCIVIGSAKNGAVRVVVDDYEVTTMLSFTGSAPVIGSTVKARVKSVDVIADRLEIVQQETLI